MDCSPSSSSVHEISQARIPAWIAISCSRRSFRPRDWTCVSYIPWIGRQILYHEWLLGSGKLFVTLLFMFPVLENNFFSSSLQTLIIGLTHGAFGEGNGTPLQCSCLENPMGTGAWWAVVHGVAKLDTTEWLHFHFSLLCIGGGNGNPLQCYCLENPWDSSAWWAAIYGVAHSQTRLKWLSSSSSSMEL